MKRLFAFFIIFAFLMSISVFVSADDDVVVLTSEGDFAAALAEVPDGGTIRIEGTVTVPKSFVWPSYGKTITFTGGMLSFTRNYNMVLGDNVRFENIKLLFSENGNFYANGHSLYIGEDVTTVGDATLYGGGKATSVASTDLTLLGGTFIAVYGGGCGGDVTGDVNLTVAGKFNDHLSGLSHTHKYCIYGGGFNSKVHGDVNLSFNGNAKANYIYGGASGSNSRVMGTIKVHFSGGKAMSIYGGSYNVDQQSNVEVLFDGGEVQQIFGGCEKSSMIGDIHVQVLGGKVTRRIYGGCYNNYDGSWKSENFVYGNILLSIGANADITLKYSGGDCSIIAHSRHARPNKQESAHVNFTSTGARVKYLDKMGAQDGTMAMIMFGAKAYDGEHILTYSVSGNVITQKCRYHDDATATIQVDNAYYTGSEIRSATVTVSDNWVGPIPTLTYRDNINMGVATVTVSVADVTAEYNFHINTREPAANWIVWVAFGVGVLIVALLGGTYFLYKKKFDLEQ